MLFALMSPVWAADTSGKPNIVVILSDDHGYQAISSYNGRLGYNTPNIDRIAQNGVRFDNCFVGNSLCAPSRGTFLTGLHAHAHGMMTNWTTFNGSQQTMPRLLKDNAGYKTAWYGKLHLKGDSAGYNLGGQVNPTTLGFQDWNIPIYDGGQGSHYSPQFTNQNNQTNTYTGQYTADVVTDQAIGWMDANKDSGQPFFLVVGHKNSHSPWTPSPTQTSDTAAFHAFENIDFPEPPTLFDDYSTREAVRSYKSDASNRKMVEIEDLLSMSIYQLNLANSTQEYPRMTTQQQQDYLAAYAPRRAEWNANKDTWTAEQKRRFFYQCYVHDYLMAVESIDKSVGRILDYLEQNALDDNTIVVYMSDQGYFIGEHNYYNKQWMYEEPLRTPFLMQWNGHIPAGTTESTIVQNIDWAPTLLEAAGVTVPSNMHGASFLGHLTGNPPADWREAIYYHYTHANGPPQQYGVRTDRCKLIYFWDINEWEMYDLQSDPAEVNNLYGQPGQEALTLQLMLRLKALRQQFNDTIGSDFTIPADLANGDFNKDGKTDEKDWQILKNGYREDLSGTPIYEMYEKGDFNGDGVVNHEDFGIFKQIISEN